MVPKFPFLEGCSRKVNPLGCDRFHAGSWASFGTLAFAVGFVGLIFWGGGDGAGVGSPLCLSNDGFVFDMGFRSVFLAGLGSGRT